jgi:hypothetical protein
MVIIKYNSYILFVGKKFEDEETRSLTNDFINTAEYVGGCEVVDLCSDSRLLNSLKNSKNGCELYEKIVSLAPVICISPCFIGNPKTTDSVKILNINEYTPQKLIKIISSRVDKIHERKAFKEFLKYIDGLLTLKPEVFGVGADWSSEIKKYCEYW